MSFMLGLKTLIFQGDENEEEQDYDDDCAYGEASVFGMNRDPSVAYGLDRNRHNVACQGVMAGGTAYIPRPIDGEPSVFGGREPAKFEGVVAGGTAYIPRPVGEPSVFGGGREPAKFEGVVAGGTAYIPRPVDTQGTSPAMMKSEGVVAGGTAYIPRPIDAQVKSPVMMQHKPVMTSPPQSAPRKIGGPYRARHDDPVDVAIAEFFSQHPAVFARNSGLTRICPSKYLVHGRQVTIEFQNRAGKGALMVKDGPLTQAFADYLENKEDDSAQYSGSVFKTNNAVHAIPQECRMTFHDTGADYSRVQAMKVAKEQAVAREQAATMISKGQLPSFEIKNNYAKSVMKLNQNRTAHSPSPVPAEGSIASSDSSTRVGTTPPSSQHSAASPLQSQHSQYMPCSPQLPHSYASCMVTSPVTHTSRNRALIRVPSPVVRRY